MDTITCILICTWGFDGSSGHSTYKQKYLTSINSKAMEDSNLFATTLIPLELVNLKGGIYWRNRTPQSVRFCRPLTLEYVKVSKDVVLAQKEEVDQQIHSLLDFIVNLENGKSVKVQYKLHLTLIDGKILHIITGTASMQKCPLCGALPTQFNKIENITSDEFKPKEDSLKYGISPLHCWIRCLECVLHISYRIPLKVWQIRGAESKVIFNTRKREVQNRLWESMGLIVDQPKVGGNGTTNDGNTARRAFLQHEKFALALNIDEQLVKRLKTILIALSCQLPLDPDLFGNFCLETAEKYIGLYPWFYMPASLHKILIHGKDIVRNSILPVGMMGEEASECRHKFYKNDRLFHSRKMSRTKTLTDQFNRALDSSDPIISSLSLDVRLKAHKSLPLAKEVLDLLLPPSKEVVDFTTESFEIIDNQEPGNIKGTSDEQVCNSFFSLLDNLELTDTEDE